MKTGKSINALATEVLELAKHKVDYALNTRSLSVLDDGRLSFRVNEGSRIVTPTDRCLHQMGARAGIPRAYMDRMNAEAKALLAQNLNHWFQAQPEKRMLRTYQNGSNVGRAFLSHKYRPLDNEDMLNAILPEMEKAGCEILSAEVTEKRLYVQARTKKVEGEVKKGDVIQAGVVVSNSEVGAGSIRVEPMLYRLVCTNGMVLPSALKKHHIGRAGDGEWDSGDAFEVFSNETRQADDKAFWMKVTDVMKDSLSVLKFQQNLAKMQESTKVDVGAPIEAVEIVTKRYGFSDDEKDNVLMHLTKGGDLSLWGLANAVTRTAEDLESYDRAMEFERIGGEVVELPQRTFKNN